MPLYHRCWNHTRTPRLCGIIKMQWANPRSWLPLTHPTQVLWGDHHRDSANTISLMSFAEVKQNPSPVIETQLGARKCRLTDDRFLGLCNQTAPTPPQTHAFPTSPLAPTASHVKWVKINTLLTHQKRSGHLIMANQVRQGMHDFSNSENRLFSPQNQHPSLRNLPQLRVWTLNFWTSTLDWSFHRLNQWTWRV